MTDAASNYPSFYKSLMIGTGVIIRDSTTPIHGVIMDKYLTEQNVFADILLDNGKTLHYRPLFVGSELTLELVH